MNRSIMFDLVDLVTEKPWINHEEARVEMGLSEDDFATVMQLLDEHLKSGRPFRPRPQPKPSLLDLLTYE